jgi:hypothetical protein
MVVVCRVDLDLSHEREATFTPEKLAEIRSLRLVFDEW